jgi:hypothetical protein
MYRNEVAMTKKKGLVGEQAFRDVLKGLVAVPKDELRKAESRYRKNRAAARKRRAKNAGEP